MLRGWLPYGSREPRNKPPPTTRSVPVMSWRFPFPPWKSFALAPCGYQVTARSRCHLSAKSLRGLTEAELRQSLSERLKQYMLKPRVVVFVKEYHSRQVAVLGAVVRPGLYNLTSGGDTLLDVISQAGGIAPGADPKIYLIPAGTAEAGQVHDDRLDGAAKITPARTRTAGSQARRSDLDRSQTALLWR